MNKEINFAFNENESCIFPSDNAWLALFWLAILFSDHMGFDKTLNEWGKIGDESQSFQKQKGVISSDE